MDTSPESTTDQIDLDLRATGDAAIADAECANGGPLTDNQRAFVAWNKAIDVARKLGI